MQIIKIKLQYIYILVYVPKVHKKDVPDRSVVSAGGSATKEM